MENKAQVAGDLNNFPPQDDTKATAAKGKPTAAKRKARKAVKKKPDDMPRRPLSAYNFFFSEMRTKLLADRAAGEESAFQKFLEERQKAEGDKKNGFFSNMGKFVAKRWKELNPEELQPYTELAEKDLQRYRREMDEYREGVARKTRLASEQKLREQEAEVSKAAQAPQQNPGQVGAAQPWMMGGGNPMMGFQNPGDPSFQLLLRQQLLNAQNPQLNAFLLQQQLGTAPNGMGGFPGMLGFQQPQQDQQAMQQQQAQQQQGNQDMGQQQQPQQQQQFPDMQQNQELLNNLQQQQNRMQSMYSNMMQPNQFGGMPMGMPGMMGMPNQDTSGGGGAGVDQMSQQLNMGQGGGGGAGGGGQHHQGGPGSGGQQW